MKPKSFVRSLFHNAYTAGTSFPPTFSHDSFSRLQPKDFFTFVWDTGCSRSISPDARDFVQGIQPVVAGSRVQGFGNAAIQGKGLVEWVVLDDSKRPYTIRTMALLVPSARVRLLSTQSYLCELDCINPPSSTLQSSTSMTLSLPHGITVTVPYHSSNNLPISKAARPLTLAKADYQYHLCVTDEGNQNLTDAQKELLRWHFRLGHRDFAAIQHLLRGGHLGNSPLTLLAGKCSHPKCASCQFGKQRRHTSHPSLPPKPLREESPTLKTNATHPGQRVFVDHFVCSTPGRLFSGFGKSKQRDQYAGGCLFVDAASRFIHTEMHVGLNTHETLAAKTKFERILSNMGVVVQEYVSDNSSIFTSSAFSSSLLAFKQTSHFAGVGAHHQNGVAERAIQTIMSMACTVMLHATIRWGEVHTSTLWPMAVDYAVWIYNHMPDPKTGLAPIDLISHTTWPRRKLKDTHVWGCPVYVLEPSIADGKKIPRWNTRSHQGVFVGFSRDHSSNIPLILNTATGNISPFSMLFLMIGSPPLLLPSILFRILLGMIYSVAVASNTSLMNLTPHTCLPIGQMSLIVLNPIIFTRRDQVEEAIHLPFDTFDIGSPDLTVSRGYIPSTPSTPHSLPSTPHLFQPSLPVPSTSLLPPTLPTPRRIVDSPTFRDNLSIADALPLIPPTPAITSTTSTIDQPSPKPPPCRSTRVCKPRDFLYLAFVSAYVTDAFPNQIASHLPTFDPCTGLADSFAADWPISPGYAMGSTMDSFGYLSKSKSKSKSDPDTLHYHEAMRAPDVNKFKEAMDEEIRALEALSVWSVVPRTSAGSKVIPGTWTFKHKRFPDGRIKKHKARFCV